MNKIDLIEDAKANFLEFSLPRKRFRVGKKKKEISGLKIRGLEGSTIDIFGNHITILLLFPRLCP